MWKILLSWLINILSLGHFALRKLRGVAKKFYNVFFSNYNDDRQNLLNLRLFSFRKSLNLVIMLLVFFYNLKIINPDYRNRLTNSIFHYHDIIC